MIYVVEIEGKGIAAFTDKRTAQEPDFKGDLMSLTSLGKPIWDGQSGIAVRDASPNEQETWRASRAKAIREGVYDDGDDREDWICFLVPVDRE